MVLRKSRGVWRPATLSTAIFILNDQWRQQMLLQSSNPSTKMLEGSSVGASQTDCTVLWNLKELDRIDLPSQPYRLPEAERQIEFLFNKIDDNISALIVEPEHKLALQILHYVSSQCWLDAQNTQAVVAGYAFLEYLSQISGGTTETSHADELAQLREEIEQLALFEDEDDEEAIPTASRDSIERALGFVENMWRVMLPQHGEMLCLPEAFSTIDRGVQLLWQVDHRQTLLIFRPDKQTIEVIVKEWQNPSLWVEVSVEDALDFARRAMYAE